MKHLRISSGALRQRPKTHDLPGDGNLDTVMKRPSTAISSAMCTCLSA
jgi:hypothetical protein